MLVGVYQLGCVHANKQQVDGTLRVADEMMRALP